MHYKPFVFRAARLLGVLLLLSACGLVRKPYERPAVQLDSLYRHAYQEQDSSFGKLPWQQVFTDPYLQAMIQEALVQNFNLQTALQNITQATAYYRQSRAAFFPTFGVTLGGSISHPSKGGTPGFGEFLPDKVEQYQVLANTSWEADIWGKLRSAKKARLASLLQTEAALRTIRTQVIAQVASNYYSLIALDIQLDIARRTLALREDNLRTLKAMKVAGQSNELTVTQGEAQVYAAAVLIPQLEQSIFVTENTINYLLGRSAGAIPRASAIEAPNNGLLRTGVPALLLANRPDVQAAEYGLMRYLEQTNAARAAMYPALSITGQAGFSSTDFSKLFTIPNTVLASIAASLTQPIFNQRALKAAYRVAQSQQEQAAISFLSTLVQAGQEVSNAMVSYQATNRQVDLYQKQTEVLAKSQEYAFRLFQGGFSNYIDVLNAENQLLSAQLSEQNAKLSRMKAVIQLYQALGGGAL